jgi:hypothetical protein
MNNLKLLFTDGENNFINTFWFSQYDNAQTFILFYISVKSELLPSLVCFDTLCAQVSDLSAQFKASCVKNDYTPINLPQLIG